MAVCAERRGTGIGAVLGEAALACARRLGASEAYLHAQAHAVPFYAALGFIAVGDGFEEAGIPHVAMRRILARTGDPD